MKLLCFIILSTLLLMPIASQMNSPEQEFLDELQYRSFLYFWELSNPQNGLTPDRAPTPSFSSVAAIGFALSSYIVGVEHQWIERTQAAQRVWVTLDFLARAPQTNEPQNCTGYKGFFYHFLDMQKGLRFQQVELSSIDTTLLLAGVLSCQIYFDRDSSIESEIRKLAENLYQRVDWRWMQARKPLISMGWHPETGFIPHDWRGYNEAMLLYILALGAPIHSIENEAWQKWTESYIWGEFEGQLHINFSPLFGHQYSHIWIDFRGIQDDYTREKKIDYFENSRRATYANREYCIRNPKKWHGYNHNNWGLTACDGPVDKEPFHTYWARGASLLEINDDGTIAPTAVGGSIPFAPEICIPTLYSMYRQHGEMLWGKYGLRDAFNLSLEHGYWFDVDYLGIDNGPIVLMIENYRNGLLWNLMKQHPSVRKGLVKAGFSGGWLGK